MRKLKLFFVGCMVLTLLGVLAACGQSSEETGSTAGAEEEKKGEEATSYPENPIKINVGFPAGGITDTAARTMADVLHKYLPNEVDVAVENKPGGGGVVAVTDVVNAKPDGYKIGLTPNAPFTIHTNYGNTAYEYEDPTLISQIIQDDVILAVLPDAPWDTFDELLEDVIANPGKYSYGTPGSGMRPDLVMKEMHEETGMEMKSVPFQGSAPARTALMGGDVDVLVSNESDIMPYAESGELKPLLNFGEKEFPDLPRAQDKGYDIYSVASFFFYGPKDLPEDIVNILDEAIKESMKDPKVVEAYKKIGLTLKYRGPEELTEMLDKEYETLGEVIANSEE